MRLYNFCLFIFIFICSSLLFSMNSKEVEVDRINLEFIKLDKQARKNLEIYLENIENRVDKMNNKINNEYLLGKKVGSSEIFLEDLTEDKKFAGFKVLNDLSIDSNKKILNNIFVLGEKIIYSDNNKIGLGLYGEYEYDKLDYNLNNLNTGLSLNGKFSEKNIYINTLNEYSFGTRENYKNHFIVGGVKLGYKQELGDIFYVEPSIKMIYLYDVGTTLKFNNTDVDIKNNFKYDLGGNIKLGIEKENNNNIYNAYLELGVDKKMNLENKFTFKFKDRDRFARVNRLYDIAFIINLGGDIYINKSHRLFLNGGLEIFDKKYKKYNINFGYQFIKELE